MGEKAVNIPTNIPGLSFISGRDGIWMCIDHDSQHAAINLCVMSEDGGKITDGVLYSWCKMIATTYGGAGE